MRIGDMIKEARKEKGLTQKDLANRLDCTVQNISQWETNKITPKLATLEKIAAALEVPFECLYGAKRPITVGEITRGPGASSKTLADMINWSLSDYVSDQLQQRLLDHFHQLNPQGQEVAVEQVELVAKVPEYRADQEHEDKEKRPHT